MRINITNDLKREILATLKTGIFEYSENSKICKLLEIQLSYFDVFKAPKKIKINRDCKLELLHWLKKGHLQTENSVFINLITPPTFLDIMKAASC